MAEAKEKHGVREPMPELTIYLAPYVDSRVDSNTFTMGNPMSDSTLSPSQGLWIWPQEVFNTLRWKVWQQPPAVWCCSSTSTFFPAWIQEIIIIKFSSLERFWGKICQKNSLIIKVIRKKLKKINSLENINSAIFFFVAVLEQKKFRCTRHLKMI